jgi:hypothetical protein
MKTRRPKGYFQNWDNLENELKRVIDKLGHFPSGDELIKLKKSSLAYAINKYHGGFHTVREKRGYEESIKQMGYWEDWKNVKRELKIVIDEVGYFPISKELRKLKKGSLASAIIAHGGFPAVRKKMGHELKRVPNGYLRDWNNFEKEMNKVIKGNGGNFPTDGELRRLRKSGLNTAINFYGGVNFIRKRMGYNELRKSKGYWKNLENVKRELKSVIKEIGHFPSHKELEDMKKGSLGMAIRKYHGKINAVREKMGYKEGQKHKGYWDNPDNFYRELKEVIYKNNGNFPTKTYLEESGRSDLSNVFKNYGGVFAVRKRMGYESKRRPYLYLQNWDNFEKEMNEVIKSNGGNFPSQGELNKLKKSSLSHAIHKYHGGFYSVRERMGYEDNDSLNKQKLEKILSEYVNRKI